LDNDQVIDFAEKPEFSENWINGGYFFFNRGFLRYVNDIDDCVLERDPLMKLARDRELSIFKHRGFWFAMDTQRDRDQLNKLWESGNAPWSVK
jgi:glucose-1-phosphate cytidylyltransferase